MAVPLNRHEKQCGVRKSGEENDAKLHRRLANVYIKAAYDLNTVRRYINRINRNIRKVIFMDI